VSFAANDPWTFPPHNVPVRAQHMRPPLCPPLSPSALTSVEAGQTPNSNALLPPGCRPHFFTSQQFALMCRLSPVISVEGAVYCSFSSLIASDTREQCSRGPFAAPAGRRATRKEPSAVRCVKWTVSSLYGALVLELEALGGDVGEQDFGAVAVKLEDLADEVAYRIVAALVEDQDRRTGAAERAA